MGEARVPSGVFGGIIVVGNTAGLLQEGLPMTHGLVKDPELAHLKNRIKTRVNACCGLSRPSTRP